MQRLYFGCASLVMLLGLSACGSGGSGVASIPQAPPPPPSGAPTIPPPVTTPTTEDFNTREYISSTSAKFSNAMPAWQAGATGKGVKIGFVDSGIALDNPEFAGRIDPASRDLAGSGTLSDEYGHGTAIASIAAAAHNAPVPDTDLLEGLAYDATIIMMKVAPAGCSNGCGFNSGAIAEGITDAAKAGAKVINLSIGGNILTSDEAKAIKSAAGSGVVFVVAAGNDSAANPSGFAAQVAAAAPGQTIIVGGVGRPTVDPGLVNYYTGEGVDYSQLSAISNSAGSFENGFMVAPGFGVRVAYKDSGADVVQGTSFSAPAVAGAAALLLQAFPNLSPREIVQILLTTADDLGAAGVDTTFGFGRLNVGRAFQPIGQTSLAGASMTVSPKVNGSAPPAIGDALERGTLNAIVLDAYQRAFTVNLARTVQRPSPARPLESAMAANFRSSSFSHGPMGFTISLLDPDVRRSLGFAAPAVGPSDASPRLAGLSLIARISRSASAALGISNGSRSIVRRLAGSGPRSFLVNQDALSAFGFSDISARSFAFRQSARTVGVTAAFETGEVQKSQSADAPARYRFSSLGADKRLGPARFFIGVGRLDESRTVLGGRLGPVFGAAGGRTLFVDGEAVADLPGDWSMRASARRGWTRFARGAFETSAYSIGVDKLGLWTADDNLALQLSQPLRVERGALSLLLPTSYDYAARSPSYNRERLNLAPDGRELAAELGYARPWRLGWASFNLYARRQPGHFARAAPDFGAAIQLKLGL